MFLNQVLQTKFVKPPRGNPMNKALLTHFIWNLGKTFLKSFTF